MWSLKFLTACARAGTPKIKILSSDGHCKKLDPPLCVKEALMDHPGHAIFHSDAVRMFGSRARPLESTMALEPGQLYFVIPIPKPHESTRWASKSAKDTPAGAERFGLEKQFTERGSRRVSFASSTSLIASTQSSQEGSVLKDIWAGSALKPSLKALPSSEDGVVRVKVLVSKQQLAEILTDGGDAATMVENIVCPILREAGVRRSHSASSRKMSRENRFSWRPTLESIYETNASISA